MTLTTIRVPLYFLAIALLSRASGAIYQDQEPPKPAPAARTEVGNHPQGDDEFVSQFIARYNKDDFRGVYALASDGFRKGIGEGQFVAFLRRNRNGGDIIRSVFESREAGASTYRLEMQGRDMLLTVRVEPPGRFGSFGLRNAPVALLARAGDVRSDNPMSTPLDRAVDAAVRIYFLHPHAVGLSIGLIGDGKRHAYHFGVTARDRVEIPNSATPYEIGSITKTFTATLLARAVIDGKVALDDDVRKHLGAGYPGLEFAGRPITLRDLANHTSRLPTLPEDVGSQPGASPLIPEANYNAEAFDAALRRFKLDGKPGEAFSYSNWGFALLGQVVTRACDKPYAELLQADILEPLRMASTTYKASDEVRRRAAVGHFENGRVAPYQDGGMFGPAGDIVSDLDDMLAYLEAQLGETTPAIALTHQPTAQSMGLGWGVRTRDGRREIQHNGSTYGFTSHISGFPGSGRGLVILSNSKAPLGGLIAAIQTELLKERDRR